jgi:transcription antitermination factor NusG
MVGEQAATVPYKIIKDLKGRENEHGVIPLENPVELLCVGDTVRIRAGALENRLAIYQGMTNQRRIRLLMTILGVERTTTIESVLIDPKPVIRAASN